MKESHMPELVESLKKELKANDNECAIDMTEVNIKKCLSLEPSKKIFTIKHVIGIKHTL